MTVVRPNQPFVPVFPKAWCPLPLTCTGLVLFLTLVGCDSDQKKPEIDDQFVAGALIGVHSMQLTRDDCSHSFPTRAAEYDQLYENSSVDKFASLFEYRRDFSNDFSDNPRFESESQINDMCLVEFPLNLAEFDAFYGNRFDEVEEYFLALSRKLENRTK